jgi:hypothetical protein
LLREGRRPWAERKHEAEGRRRKKRKKMTRSEMAKLL